MILVAVMLAFISGLIVDRLLLLRRRRNYGLPPLPDDQITGIGA